ncbi:Frataxin, mitochondrial [Armadillidium vulgare]|nr:Frataxin, mitochondrial [Armadillidium vulgare]
MISKKFEDKLRLRSFILLCSISAYQISIKRTFNHEPRTYTVKHMIKFYMSWFTVNVSSLNMGMEFENISFSLSVYY